MKTREWALVALTVAAIVILLFVPPVPQDADYHQFADTRDLFGIPHFWNVVSNAGYLVVGIYAIRQTHRLSSPILRTGYRLFCIGVVLVSLGSSWYHFDPSTDSLLWDRLPMSVAFMALLSLLLGERVSWRLGATLLWPLVVIGVASVLYWAWTESRGAGDLRPYGLVQFLPMLLIPILLIFFPGSRRGAVWLWYTFAAYAVAKIAEHFDASIYDALTLSGHSIKHIVSALAVLFAVFALLEMKAPPER